MIKKLLVVFLSIMLTLQSMLVYAGVEMDKQPFNDIEGHIAEETIMEHYKMGMLKGYPDGEFKPDKKMLISELITLINRYFVLSKRANSNYEDVKENEWYVDDAAKARYYQYVEGLKLRPEEEATREDVVNMLSAILDIEEQKEKNNIGKYEDLEGIDEKTKERIENFSKLGYLNGYDDGTFRPKETIKRIEIMSIVTNVLGYIVFSQEDLDNIPEGVEKITIASPNIVIENKIIKGDIYISPGVNGKVLIKNTKVEGKIEIAGGSQEDPVEIENVDTKKIVITKAREIPKVKIKGNSIIGELKTKTETNVEILGKTKIENVNTKTKTDLELGEKTEITNLTIEGETNVETKKGSKINELNTKGKTKITGEGNIKKAYIDNSEVEIEKKPKYIKVNDKVGQVEVGGKKVSSKNDDYPSAIIITDRYAPTLVDSGLYPDNSISHNSINIRWTKAIDNKTKESNLEYIVYYSASNIIRTVEEIEKHGIPVGDYTKDIQEYNITGLSPSTNYLLNVIVKDEAGNKTAYMCIMGTTSQAPDTESPAVSNRDISIPYVTYNSLVLSWNKASDNRTMQSNLKYRVYYSTSDNIDSISNIESGTPVGDYEKDINTKAITGLNETTTYYFNVIVKDEVGNKSIYQSTSCTTLLSPDIQSPTVSNTTLSTSNVTHDSVELSWNKASDNRTTEGNLEYKVYYSTNNNMTTVGNIESGTPVGDYEKDINTKAITGLNETTTYYFNVIVKDEVGNKSIYQSTSCTTLLSPDIQSPTVSNTTLSTNNVTHNSVVLNWNKASDNRTTEGNLEYRVYYSINNNMTTVGNVEGGTPVGDYTKDINTKTITGLNETTTYYFNVIVKDEVGNKSIYQSTSCTTLLSPDIQSPTVSNTTLSTNNVTHNSVVLNWNKASDNRTTESNLEYRVYYSINNNMTTVGNVEGGTPVGDYTKDINTKAITGLNETTTYYFNVIVKDEVGNKSIYQSTSCTTLLSPDIQSPTVSNTTLSTNNVTHNSVVLNWNKASDNRTTEGNLEYRVYYSTNNNMTTVGNVEGGTPVGDYEKDINTKAITGLNETTTYYFNVIVKDEVGNKSIYQSTSCTTLLSPDIQSPTVSNTTLSTNNVTHNSVVLNWNKASDNRTTEGNLEYRVYYSTNNNMTTVGNVEGGTPVGDYEKDINTKAITGLNETTTYYFNVIVKDEAGNKSIYQSTSCTTLLSPDIQSPTVSNTTLSTSNVTYNSVELSWNKASDNRTTEGNLEYRVYYSTSNNMTTVGNIESGTPVEDYTKDINTKAITGLNETTTYYFNVIVKDEAGNKSIYQSTSCTTLLSPDTQSPTVSNTTLSTSNVTHNSVELSWNKASDNRTTEGNLEYRVYYSINNNMTTAGNIESGTPVGDYVKDINTKAITGLNETTTYYFNVIVKDEAGNKSIYGSASCTTIQDYGSGIGTDPFKIYKIEDLAKVGSGQDGWNIDSHYILMNDLDFENANDYNDASLMTQFTQGAGWDPIGDGSNAFTGSFKSNNNECYAIKNLYINRSSESYIGLFARLESSISNLTLENVNITGDGTIGSICGLVRNGELYNCSSSGSISGNDNNVGGICGDNSNSSILYCHNSCQVNCISKYGASVQTNVGGIAGIARNGTIKGCINSGNVNNTLSGGIVGTISENSTVSYCYNTIDINANSISGGIVGQVNATNTIRNCYNTGDITSGSASGGIVGFTQHQNSTVDCCYSLGEVSSNYGGGIVGRATNRPQIRNCIAFNTRVVASNSISGYRIVGNWSNASFGPILSNNYAREDMDAKSGDPKTANNSFGANIASLSNKNEPPMQGVWDFDESDVDNDGFYWKIPSGDNKRPIIYIKIGSEFIVLGNDDGSM